MNEVPPTMLADYSCGGYLIMRPAPRDAYLDPSLADTILSVSDCICDSFPTVWWLQWSEFAEGSMAEDAAPFGVPGESVSGLLKWCMAAVRDGRIVWPNVFRSVDAARECAAQFHFDMPNLSLIGIGIRQGNRGDIEETPGSTSPRAGIPLLASENRRLAGGGCLLGFDVLGYEACQFHSWLCGLGVEEIFEQVKVKPGELGLFAKAQEAEDVAAYCNREDVATEPVLWRSWMIVGYDWQ